MIKLDPKNSFFSSARGHIQGCMRYSQSMGSGACRILWFYVVNSNIIYATQSPEIPYWPEFLDNMNHTRETVVSDLSI